MQTVHLEAAQVPPHLRAGYTGRKFTAQVVERVEIPAGAGQWDGGSRDTYSHLRIADGAPLSLTTPGPLSLTPGFAVIRRSVFMGKDSGVTIYVHPHDVAALLPAQAGPSLSVEAHTVLALAAGIIPARRREIAADRGIDAQAYASLCASHARAGLMTDRGAITTAGRNALGALPRMSF